MRRYTNKLTKGHSTKAERRFAELLKKYHIPFRTKVIIENREVDFVIGSTVIEIDGHPQNPKKNIMLLREGYDVIHLNSWEIPNANLEKWLKQKWQGQDLGHHIRQ